MKKNVFTILLLLMGFPFLTNAKEEDADYIFETGGTFTLGKNVKINRGAKLLIKPSKIEY